MWYILSYNQIHGNQTGAFDNLDMLFYARQDFDGCHWVGLASKAHPFESKDQAQFFAEEVWGKDMADDFMYAEFDVDHFGQDREEYAEKRAQERNEMSRRLASKTITAEELKSYDPQISTNFLTWRERWIIQIMSEA